MTWPGPRYSMLAGSGQTRLPCKPSATNLGDHHWRCCGRDIGYPPFRRRQQVRIAMPPYRLAGCHGGSRPAARASRARAFRRRTEQPSRRDRARPDAGSPCTRRSAGRRRQQCRASSVRAGLGSYHGESKLTKRQEVLDAVAYTFNSPRNPLVSGKLIVMYLFYSTLPGNS